MTETRKVLIELFEDEKKGIEIQEKRQKIRQLMQEAKIEEQKGFPLKARQKEKEVEELEKEVEKEMSEMKPAKEKIEDWLERLKNEEND